MHWTPKNLFLPSLLAMVCNRPWLRIKRRRNQSHLRRRSTIHNLPRLNRWLMTLRGRRSRRTISPCLDLSPGKTMPPREEGTNASIYTDGCRGGSNLRGVKRCSRSRTDPLCTLTRVPLERLSSEYFRVDLGKTQVCLVKDGGRRCGFAFSLSL